MSEKLDPNSSLPSNMEGSISVIEMTKQIEQAMSYAKELAAKANRIYRKKHPEDTIDTAIYDSSDFIKDGVVSIPKEIQEMFDEAEKATAKEPTYDAEYLKKMNNIKSDETPANKEKYDESKVKKHPVYSKLLASFGLEDEFRPKVVTVSILGMDWTFEYPTSFVHNFAVAFATTEGIGSLDFGYNLHLAIVSLSIIAIDNIPVSTVYDLNTSYTDAQEIPSKLRKICAIRTMDMINALPEDKAELFFKAYSDNIGFPGGEDEEKLKDSNFAELDCPKCASSKVVSLVEGNVPIRYCELCGTKMELVSTKESDENLPLE